MFSLHRLAVRVISSERAGSGKSLAVCRLSQRLSELQNNDAVMDYLKDMSTDVPLCISVPIYGPIVHQRVVVESLLPHIIVPDLPLSRIFHFDVHPSVIYFGSLSSKDVKWFIIVTLSTINDGRFFPQVRGGLDTLLFNLLILGALKNSSGQIWRRRSSDLYVIEITSGVSPNVCERVERRQTSTKVSGIMRKKTLCNTSNKISRISLNAVLFLNRSPRKTQRSPFTGFFPRSSVEHRCKHYISWELI